MSLMISFDAVAITFSHPWMVNSSNYKFFATKLSAANCSFACNYQSGLNKYGNTITCQKVKIKWEIADFKNVWQTNSLINPGTPYWLTSLSVNISGREMMGFYNPSRKTSNTFASKLERFWPSPSGYAFEKNIDTGENKIEHIKGNIGNLNTTLE